MVIRCGTMVWSTGNMVVCCDARCEILNDVEWFDAILNMV